MAAPKGGNKGSFKKGKSGNPAGKKPLPPDIREAKNFILEDIIKSVYNARSMTVSEANSNLSTMKLGERAIISAYLLLDYQGIKIFEDRVLGKPKETAEITMPEGIQIVFSNKTKQD
jgi:hypothetical protein